MLFKKNEFSHQIHVLHGFLGRPADWHSLDLKGIFKQRVVAPDLFKDFPIDSFVDWAKRYHVEINKNSSQDILMGYSLGGRLGLHLVLEDPKLWKAAIFISTHPGLKSIEERKTRVIVDNKWVERFENEPWESLLQAWNAQGVFTQDTFSFERLEADYCRKALSKALSVWSLGKQKDLSDQLYALDIPILWMVGAEDAKILQKAQELKFKHPKSKVCVIANAAHRLPWQQPEKFLLNATQFIESLEQ